MIFHCYIKFNTWLFSRFPLFILLSHHIFFFFLSVKNYATYFPDWDQDKIKNIKFILNKKDYYYYTSCNVHGNNNNYHYALNKSFVL